LQKGRQLGPENAESAEFIMFFPAIFASPGVNGIFWHILTDLEKIVSPGRLALDPALQIIYTLAA
jgi:hypothetical protein